MTTTTPTPDTGERAIPTREDYTDGRTRTRTEGPGEAGAPER